LIGANGKDMAKSIVYDLISQYDWVARLVAARGLGQITVVLVNPGHVVGRQAQGLCPAQAAVS